MTVAGPKTVAGFALLGALSGAIATGLRMVLSENSMIEIGGLLFVSPLSILAGLVFGTIFGAVLRYLGLASAPIATLYAAASTVSYFVAVNLAIHLVDTIEAVWLLGAIVGFAGAACLTAATAWLFPFARKKGPCALMVVTGGVLGTLLEFPMMSGPEIRDIWDVWNWMTIFVPWQAGYAAAFATALPAARAKG